MTWNDVLVRCAECGSFFDGIDAVFSYEDTGREIAICPGCLAACYWHSPRRKWGEKWLVDYWAMPDTWRIVNENSLKYWRSHTTALRRSIAREVPFRQWHSCNEYDCGDESELCAVWANTDAVIIAWQEAKYNQTYGAQ